jgi:hypothetical protein
MSVKTYRGSCHCGAVRYEADIDLAAGVGKCNCSICTKTRAWSATVKPSAVRVLEGEESLSDYRFGTNRVHHFFCRHCGVRPFAKGTVDPLGEFYSLALHCIDGVDPEDLLAAPVHYSDGRRDDWGRAPAEVRHL